MSASASSSPTLWTSRPVTRSSSMTRPGSVIGEGTLGEPERSIDESRPAYADTVVCRLPFRVGDVRRTDAVRIDIGSHTRATYDTAALDGRGWYVELELGS